MESDDNLYTLTCVRKASKQVKQVACENVLEEISKYTIYI